MLNRWKIARLAALILLPALPAMPGCSKDKNPTKPPVNNDVTAPSAVIDLAAVSATGSRIALTWTATGDDAVSGTASAYDIRYSTSRITEDSWTFARLATGEPVPKAAGVTETFVVTGLSSNTRYHFALKVLDEKPNPSALSNVLIATTIAGNAWLPLGSGTGGQVRALTVYDGQLVAGGNFDSAGGAPAGNIAAWDGSSWSPLGSGTDGQVYALTVYDGQLTAGGNFDSAGGVSAEHIAVWDGSSWSPLAPGLDGMLNDYVNVLTVQDGQLLVGGRFGMAGWVIGTRGVAVWDGSSWSPLGSGMDYEVHALTVYNGQLMAGGDFFNAGGAGIKYAAAWDGSSWQPLGSGTNWPVVAWTLYNGQLIAGGDFYTAGGISAPYVAAWSD